MGIDYVIDLPCDPKRALGVEQIVNLVKARSRAEAVLELVRKDGDARGPDQISITTVLQTTDGVTEQQVTVQELLDQARALDDHRAACASCPANAGRDGFGCYRSIAYPITEDAEAWMLGRLPDDLESSAGVFLVRALADFGWDGEHAAEMRGQGDTFFESDDALAVRWGDEDDEDGLQVDADQIFHMLFHVGNIGETHAMMLCLFFGVLPHDVDLEVLRDDDARRKALAAATLPPQGSPGIEAFAELLRALALAASLDVDVLIDG